MDLAHYLRPLRFRPYAAADFEPCVALYASNEPDHVPGGYRPHFKEWLNDDGETLILLAESEGRLVACGGVAYQGTRDVAVLSFGIVHAEHRRRGFGTTLLTARLALLEPGAYGCTVGMEVTSASFSFYRRFGFQGYGVSRDERGNCFGSFARQITAADVTRCRQLLFRVQAVLPSTYEVPGASQPS